MTEIEKIIIKLLADLFQQTSEIGLAQQKLATIVSENLPASEKEDLLNAVNSAAPALQETQQKIAQLKALLGS